MGRWGFCQREGEGLWGRVLDQGQGSCPNERVASAVDAGELLRVLRIRRNLVLAAGRVRKMRHWQDLIAIMDNCTAILQPQPSSHAP